MDARERDTEPPVVAPTYYANSVRVLATAVDFAIEFGYDTAEGEVKPLARVAMSWEEAFVIQRIIARSIDDYAAQMGAVRDVIGDAPILGEDLDDNVRP
jgi:hypothetical protein